MILTCVLQFPDRVDRARNRGAVSRRAALHQHAGDIQQDAFDGTSLQHDATNVNPEEEEGSRGQGFEFHFSLVVLRLPPRSVTLNFVTNTALVSKSVVLARSLPFSRPGLSGFLLNLFGRFRLFGLRNIKDTCVCHTDLKLLQEP